MNGANSGELSWDELDSVIYIYDGGTFVPYTVYIYNGISWDKYSAHIYDGTSWQILK